MAEPTPQMLSHVAERFRAFSDENRLRLLMELKDGEQNVTTLSERTGIRQASVSKHLGVLRRVGIVQVRRDGAQSICSIRAGWVAELCDLMCGVVLKHHQDINAELGLGSGK